MKNENWVRKERLTKSLITSTTAGEYFNANTGERTVKQVVIKDTDQKGFAVQIGRNQKTFFVLRRGKRTTIGHFGELTVEQARDKARLVLAELNGAITAKPTPFSLTVREALEMYLETMRAKNRSPLSVHRVEYNVRHYLADWLDRPLISITKTETRQKHFQIAADIKAGKYATVKTVRNGKELRTYTRKKLSDGKSTANTVLVNFGGIWNRALKGDDTGTLPPSPTSNVDFFPSKKKNKAIPTKDLPNWYAAACALDNPVRRDILLFGMWSGLRRESLRTMRWEHVDWKHKAVLIPKPKGGEIRAFWLPLSEFLMDILREREQCE